MGLLREGPMDKRHKNGSVTVPVRGFGFRSDPFRCLRMNASGLRRAGDAVRRTGRQPGRAV